MNPSSASTPAVSGSYHSLPLYSDTAESSSIPPSHPALLSDSYTDSTDSSLCPSLSSVPVVLSSSPASLPSSLGGSALIVTSGLLPSDAVSRSRSLRRSFVSCPVSPLLLTTVSISSSRSFSETMLVSFASLLFFTAAASFPPWHPVMIRTLTHEATAAVFSIRFI